MRTVKNVLTAIAAIFLIAGSVSPSHAHTESETTTPAAGETVAAGEQLVSISFTEPVAKLANSTEIVVTDPSGYTVKTDCTGVEENKIYTNAFLPTEGDYEVTWRTVAEDGHPVSGKFSFSVSGNSEVEYTTPACAIDTPTSAPTPKALAGNPEDVVKTEANDALTPFIGSGIAVLVAAFAGWLLLRRKSNSKE